MTEPIMLEQVAVKIPLVGEGIYSEEAILIVYIVESSFL